MKKIKTNRQIVDLRSAKKEPVIRRFYKKPARKALALFLIAGLNWLGFWVVIQAGAFFNDTESGQKSVFRTAVLDFSLASEDDFSPLVIPGQDAERNIEVANNGSLDLKYDISLNITGGLDGLCQVLDLETWLDGEFLASSSLLDFNFYNLNIASGSVDVFDFKAVLSDSGYEYWNELCGFEFIFDGRQADGNGFTDTETIVNTVESGTWSNLADHLLINKVYYDVDGEHGEECKNEWIELYNPTDEDIVLKNWQICDKDDCARINADVSIASSGYALLSHGADTWKYWDIPAAVLKINQLGGSFFCLDNSADMLMLMDPDGDVVDRMNWGEPDYGWDNASTTLWDPGIPDAEEGHMLGRAPSGYDTDAPSDFADLSLPEVELLYPVGGEIWFVGRTYDITWRASSTNSSLDEDLDISLYYSKNSGGSWGVIATSTENDGLYSWRVPLFLEDGAYYVPSGNARIKVQARGPENFMVVDFDMSADFCPPIDYDMITDEERDILRILGLLPDSEDPASGNSAGEGAISLPGPEDITALDSGGDGTGDAAGEEPADDSVQGDGETNNENTEEPGEESVDNSELLPPATASGNEEGFADLENPEAGDAKTDVLPEENIDSELNGQEPDPELENEAEETGCDSGAAEPEEQPELYADATGAGENEINEQPTGEDGEDTDNSSPTKMDYSQESSGDLPTEN